DYAGSSPPKAGKQHEICERPKNSRSSAKSGERKTDRQARSIGEPLGHDGNNCPEAESKANAAEHAVEKIERVKTGCMRKKKETQAHQNASRHRDPKRSELIL